MRARQAPGPDGRIRHPAGGGRPGPDPAGAQARDDRHLPQRARAQEAPGLGYYTAPQASALGRRIPQPRGRVLELIREVMASPAIAGQVSLELNPGPDFPDRAALARELPNR